MRSQYNRPMACEDCGIGVLAKSSAQRYCEDCSKKHDLIRKRLWSIQHPLSEEQKQRNQENMKKTLSCARQAGLMSSNKTKRSVSWLANEPCNLLWNVRIAIPFSYAVSKNHIYALRRDGHVAMRRESRAKRDEIIIRLRQALGEIKIVENKLWIDIFVQKPNHKGDAINVIDLVCDGIKDAISLDDRWFCIRRLDWEIVKYDPKLFIGIGQDTDLNCRICSYCGQIKSFSEFTKAKHNRLGISRECKQCLREGRLIKQVETKQEAPCTNR